MNELGDMLVVMMAGLCILIFAGIVADVLEHFQDHD